jgi:hypothetical protein
MFDKMITSKGETMCISKWAERAGMCGNILRNRLDLGWDFERAMTETTAGTCPHLHFEYHGVTKTTAEWAKHVGMKRDTLYFRLKHGWSVSDALTKPVRTKRK